jgi:exodeoxyribonuclease VII small subunit
MAKDARAARQQEETFEQLYEKLENAVGRLEKGGLSLDEAIALYEEGMALARECQQRLHGAEQRITKLRESFAPVGRHNGETLAEAPEDYEYVDELGEDVESANDDFP